MNRAPLAILVLFFALQAFPAIDLGAENTPALADDPRVSDAIAAWAEWVEYQIGINAVPGATVAIVHDQELDRYVGIYDSDWGQEAIVRWEDGLAMLSLGTRNPGKGMQKLKKTGEHSFRRVRKDDESLGETVFFEVNDEGVVTRALQHSNWSMKVR